MRTWIKSNYSTCQLLPLRTTKSFHDEMSLLSRASISWPNVIKSLRIAWWSDGKDFVTDGVIKKAINLRRNLKSEKSVRHFLLSTFLFIRQASLEHSEDFLNEKGWDCEDFNLRVIRKSRDHGLNVPWLIHQVSIDKVNLYRTVGVRLNKYPWKD